MTGPVSQTTPDILSTLRHPTHDPGGRTRIALPAGVVGSARYGGHADCYRYTATYWDRDSASTGTVMFLMLNPSTATAGQFDPTLAKCWRYARRWGCSTMMIGNTFAYRATDQARLAETNDAIGPENDARLLTMAQSCDRVVMAYGTPRIPALCGRGPEVARTLRAAGVKLHVLRLSQAGRPWHPLYLPDDLEPQIWEGPDA